MCSTFVYCTLIREEVGQLQREEKNAAQQSQEMILVAHAIYLHYESHLGRMRGLICI